MLRELSKLSKEELAGKRVLVRCDLDVARDELGNVTEDYRLQKMVPTLKFFLESAVKQIIICGHLNRPEGQVKETDRLDQVAMRLSELLGQSINKLDDVLPEKVPEDKLVMLENLRFCSGEEANDEWFGKTLAAYADIYINDCFSDCHRNHASMVGVTKLLPSYAGLQLIAEANALSEVMIKPERPLIVIIGGAKIETKMPVIQNFVGKANYVLVGGKIGFEALRANHDSPLQIGNVILPVDGALENKDIGSQTIMKFVEIVKTAKTVVWNGPLGMFEDDKFILGTEIVAKAIIDSRAKSIVGGGDTVAALQKLNLLDKMGFVSTGGGAMLDFLAGLALPGVTALYENS